MYSFLGNRAKTKACIITTIQYAVSLTLSVLIQNRNNVLIHHLIGVDISQEVGVSVGWHFCPGYYIRSVTLQFIIEGLHIGRIREDIFATRKDGHCWKKEN